MKKMYSESKNWNERNYKKSFENLVNDGFDFERLQLKKWFIMNLEGWKAAVLCNKLAKKVVNETEKAIEYEFVNQYGNVYNMWFPKSVIE